MEFVELPVSEIAKIVIPGILAFITGRYLSQYSRRATFSHESFYDLYQPMYNVVRPYLYKEPDDRAEFLIMLKILMKIVKNKEHLVIGDLRDDIEVLIHRCENSRFDKVLFDQICLSIERVHRKLKKTLGYPVQFGFFYLARHGSFKRLKARLKRLDLIAHQVFIALLMLFLLVIATNYLYGAFIDFVNWLTDLVQLYNQSHTPR